jgi:hypothetical protein
MHQEKVLLLRNCRIILLGLGYFMAIALVSGSVFEAITCQQSDIKLKTK